MQDLLSTMLVLDPTRRATLEQVGTHRWVTGSLAAATLPAPLLERHGSAGTYLFDPIILHFMADLGISTTEVIERLSANACDQVAATYLLLAEAKLRDPALPRLSPSARDLGPHLVRHVQRIASMHGFSLDVGEASDLDDPSHFAPPRTARPAVAAH